MNIVFKTIEISNFLSLGKNISIDLNERGFTLVSGHNVETKIPQSNGSGKSSIFDAIFWTITGETLRGTTDVVNENSSGGCRCTLTLDVDGTVYKIMRSKSDSEYGNSCYFYENDELLSDQIRKSQEMISKTIPTTSSDILGSIILLGQGLPYRFSALSPSKRKDLLEVMSGSSSQADKLKYQLDIEESEYSAKSRDLGNQITSLTAEVRGLQRSQDALHQQKSLVQDTETIASEISSHNSQNVEISNEIDQISQKLPGVRDQESAFSSALNNVNAYITKTRADIAEIENLMSQVKSGNCPTCGRPYDGQDEARQALSDYITRRDSLLTTLGQLQTKGSGLQVKVNELRSQINSLTNRETSLRHTIETNNLRVQELGRLKETADGLDSQIAEIGKEIRDRNIQIHDSEAALSELQPYLDCIGYLKRQVSRDFKGYMLEEVIKYLSTRSEYYSEYLFSNGKKIEVSLTGNKILISVGGRLYENLSGGERQRVDLAVQFALRDMLVVTSGFSCNLIVLDEAFDNLDAQGSESLIRLVTSEFSDIDSVFVVTHHSTIAIPYDNSLLVTKGSDGISTVKEEV